MDYLIKIDQKTLMFIKYLIAQRPYAEVAVLLSDIERQQVEQDESNAIPTNQLEFESINKQIQELEKSDESM